MDNTTLHLTNGSERFMLSQITSDNNGPAHGLDSRGSGYSRCDIGCDHEPAPESARVWHDEEHTETLWED